MPRYYDKRAVVEQIAQLRAKCWTYRQIAQAIGVSFSYCKALAQSFGIQERRYGRAKGLNSR